MPKERGKTPFSFGIAELLWKFNPKLSTLLQPLHELLRKGVKWTWTKECENAFAGSQSELTAGEVLVSYDEKRKLNLGGMSYGWER